MLDLTGPRDFHPVRLPRRSEGIAWALSAVLLATWWVLQANEAALSGTAALLLAFMVFSASTMSLASWMDRRTRLTLDPAGVFFENGLRRVRLGWDEIRKVRVIPAQAGSQRVQVLGAAAHFEFRTLAEVRLQGEIKGRAGFEAGEAILKTILGRARLSKMQDEAAYTYYARE